MERAAIREVGRALARRHEPVTELDEHESLLNYAERRRPGGWSLRASLVRVAQPEPQRASAVLESLRRCDGALHGSIRLLQEHLTMNDRRLDPDAIDDPFEPYPDVRVADLARIARGNEPHLPALLGSYNEISPLEAGEASSVPLCIVALELDDLGDVLDRWATERSGPPPIDRIDEVIASTRAALDDLDIPRETGPPRGR